MKPIPNWILRCYDGPFQIISGIPLVFGMGWQNCTLFLVGLIMAGMMLISAHYVDHVMEGQTSIT